MGGCVDTDVRTLSSSRRYSANHVRDRGRIRLQDGRRHVLRRIPERGRRTRRQRSQRNGQCPSSRGRRKTRIRVRMALHTGTCTERDGDYFGSTVNRAARLEAIAHGGQTNCFAGNRERTKPHDCRERDVATGSRRAPVERPDRPRTCLSGSGHGPAGHLPAIAIARQPVVPTQSSQVRVNVCRTWPGA